MIESLRLTPLEFLIWSAVVVILYIWWFGDID